MNKKNIFITIGLILFSALVAGGTYAYLSITANVTNAVSNGTVACFLIDYTDNTNQITGTLFPSGTANKGLSGGVSFKTNSSCNVDGTGTLYLNIDSTTSSKFGTVAAAHCENSATLETLKDYDTSAACTSGGGSWVTNGTVLKYAIYTNSTGTGTPIKVGYFDGSKIGNRMVLQDNIAITSTQINYYIFFWLDGYLTDNTYTNLAFSGSIKLEAVQGE